MRIKRIDFVIDNDQEMSFLYDEDVLTEEEAKEIINHPTVQMSGFSNLVLEKNTPCFFLSTPQADMLNDWVNQIVKMKSGNLKYAKKITDDVQDKEI